MPEARGALLTRVGPLGVVAVVWVAIAIMFPTSEPDSSVSSGVPNGGGFSAAPTGGTGGGSTPLTTTVAGPSGTAATAVPGTAGNGAAATATASTGANPSPAPSTGGAVASTDPSSSAAMASAGLTRDGRVCEPGVRQIPISTYATNCLPVFTGDNGGATWRGVTGDEITIVERRFADSANSQAVDSVSQSAGVASDADNDVAWQVFRDYMNDTFELYGRRINWVTYESQYGDSTTEAQSKGRENACLDADVVANELNAFAVVGERGIAVTGPFAECAAERGVVVLSGAAYFPERFYAERHPYVWAYTMECERITQHTAEYIGKRLGTKNARWSGDPLYQNSPRKYGVYVPNNDQYQFCVDKYVDTLQRGWGIDGAASRYNYTLDVSRFPDEAARGAVQFKADGITTLVMACDPISAIFITQAATKQAWFPEWMLIGVASQDTDLFASLYDPTAVDGHLFGMSQLGETDKVVGPDSEAGALYTYITGEPLFDGASGGYIYLNMVMDMLQNAGPNLTPDAIAAGVTSIPVGGAPDYPYGKTSFATTPDGQPGMDHTWVEDSREIYWDGTNDTFIATYGGQRFTNGEWPAEDPPIYPEG